MFELKCLFGYRISAVTLTIFHMKIQSVKCFPCSSEEFLTRLQRSGDSFHRLIDVHFFLNTVVEKENTKSFCSQFGGHVIWSLSYGPYKSEFENNILPLVEWSQLLVILLKHNLCQNDLCLNNITFRRKKLNLYTDCINHYNMFMLYA